MFIFFVSLTGAAVSGCEKIFSEKVSGVKERPVLKECLSYLREGDTLVVYKFDRIG
ncbi:recombinase family protein, partial [Hallella absiana]|uniref:recombinase family protein n=1 Tax=Hallella absiana TaxID=2925336 RepID=UPI003211B1B1